MAATASLKVKASTLPWYRKFARKLSKLATFGFIEDRLGNRRKITWTTLLTLGVAMPALSVLAVFRMITSHISLGVILFGVGMYVFTMFGVTLGYHRYLTHGGLKAKLWLTATLLVAGAMSWQNSAREWVRDHRRHHDNSDIPGLDPHAPLEYGGGIKGNLWAEGFWLMFDHDRSGKYGDKVKLDKQTGEPVLNPKTGKPVMIKYAITSDPQVNRLVDIQEKAFLPLAILSLGIGVPFYPWFGLNGVLIAGPLRILALILATGLINSICHRFGKPQTDSLGRPYLADLARNIGGLIALITGGESLHGAHHAEPRWVFHGWGKRAIDPTKWLIIVLDHLGAVWDLKKPNPKVVFRANQVTPGPIAVHSEESSKELVSV